MFLIFTRPLLSCRISKNKFKPHALCQQSLLIFGVLFVFLPVFSQRDSYQQGGKFLDHIYVRRGRIYNQISGSELIEKVREVLEDRESKWREFVNFK